MYYFTKPAMFSKILIKLIDQAIVPAIFLLTIRVMSVILVSKYFGIFYLFGNQGFYFSNPEHFLIVNSYSTLIMVLATTIGLLYILLKSFFFHETHVSPGLTAKLFSLKLSSFIQSSFDLYSQGSIWLSYLYLLLMVSGLMALFGMIYLWVFYVSLTLTVLSTIFLILDVENEINLESQRMEPFDETENILEIQR